ncbi:MAG: NIPSNAP family protein [Alphaproteobacteria bacterium]|nr:NIPSNAP family protein [Alphaproteobacteria bacterium]
MALYELRTYTLYVGRLGEVVKLYGDEGWRALEKGGFGAKLVGYFTSDVGTLNQLVHLWKFDDDADRRNHWNTLFQDDDFMAFAGKLRPMIMTQTVQLLNASPWGPHP